jgi:DNA uptake protein ComE-like DNA-binding protein
VSEPESAGKAQRGVLIALLSFILLYLVIRLILNPVHVPDPQPPTGPRAGEIEDRIDPNTADWSTLAALPQIGERRARDIVAYREQFLADNPGKTAFTRAQDLYRVRGFGVAMVSLIEPYLIFPATQPSTIPAP